MATGQPPPSTNAAASAAGIATSRDAFRRLRVSSPYTLFDSQNRYIVNDKFSTLFGGGGNFTFNANESSLSLNVGTSSGDSVTRETTRVFAYQPGKSLFVMSSFLMAAGQTNLTQRIGYFGAQNGIFLEQVGTTLNMVLRNYATGSSVETRIAQANWSDDKFDGTGPSGVVIDVTKTNVFFIDLGWFGIGDVRCGFIVNGDFYVGHTFRNANDHITVFMTTACLPVRMEITNTGVTASPSTFKEICTSVQSEAGFELTGSSYSAGTGVTYLTLPTAGTLYPLVSIRLDAARLDAIVMPNLLSILPNTGNVLFSVVVNGTLGGPTSWVTHSHGTIDYDVSSTSIVGGTELWGGYCVEKSVIEFGSAQLQLGRSLIGVADIMTICAIPFDKNSQVAALLSWSEIIT